MESPKCCQIVVTNESHEPCLLTLQPGKGWPCIEWDSISVSGAVLEPSWRAVQLCACVSICDRVLAVQHRESRGKVSGEPSRGRGEPQGHAEQGEVLPASGEDSARLLAAGTHSDEPQQVSTCSPKRTSLISSLLWVQVVLQRSAKDVLASTAYG